MLPIRDHNPSEKTPFVNYALIAVNVIVFLSYWGQLDDYRYMMSIFGTYAFTPVELTEQGEVFGLFTSMYLHGGFMHLAGNMLFLWIFGDNLEEEFGHLRYFLFYTVTGVIATLAHYVAAPYSDIPLVGASGAIAGVMGGYLLLYPRARIDILFYFLVFFRIVAVPAWIMLGVWFGLQLFNGTLAGTGSGVAYWAHAGGFVAGFLFALPLWLRRGGTGYWRSNAGQPPHPDAEYDLQPSRVPHVKRVVMRRSSIPNVKRTR
ncbi:MAG: rhomboid family intramembrane serine protease [Paracoccaceae bacterium]|jgi:membrane associated rhomboid family serine protease|nr:rhomboid family intramembrane serine protease [Paracoccaceae bacterium]MDP7184525.1 rhomboid family intramembrane serine protease [Paracoccaceae bacterium]